MSQIGALLAIGPGGQMKSADVDQNFADCRTGHNGARGFLFWFANTAGGANAYYAPGDTQSYVLEAQAQLVVPVGCTFVGLSVRAPNGVSGAGNVTFTLRKNGVDTLVSLVIPGGSVAGVYRDLLHTADFAAGDLLSVHYVENGGSGLNGGAPAIALTFRFQAAVPPVVFAPSTKVSAQDIGLNFTSLASALTASFGMLVGKFQPGVSCAANATRYAAHNWPYALAVTAGNAEFLAPCDGSLSGLYVQTTGAQPADGALTFRLQKNGADTALFVTVPANAAAGVYANTNDVVAVVRGDKLRWKLVNASPVTPSAVLSSWSVRQVLASFAPSTYAAGAARASAPLGADFAAMKAAHNGIRLMLHLLGNLGTEGVAIAAATTEFLIASTGFYGGGEATNTDIIDHATTIRNLHVVMPAAQPASGNLVVTLRVNGADTALTVIVPANSAAGFTVSDVAHAVALNAGDRLSLKLANAAAALTYTPAVTATIDL